MRDCYIDGVWLPAADGSTRQVVNPGDGTVVRTVADGGVQDTKAAIRAARRAFDEGPWPSTPPLERGRTLTRIADLLESDRDELAHLETQDTGKTLTESGWDVDDAVAVFRYYAGLVDRSLGVVVPTTSTSSRSVVSTEPVGVCALITPWNYPLLQASWKLAPALAAGCTLVCKPSELTPMTTIRCFELLEAAGVPTGVANLVLGPGPTVGAELAASDDVDLVSFTGGIATGQTIMRSAAGNVKRIALELGGKNPNIVFADADLEVAVDHALLAAYLHAGQVCSAGARLLIESPVHDELVDLIVERVRAIRLGHGTDPDTEMGPLISAEHRAKVEAHVTQALEEGALLATGGRRPDDPALASGFFYEPTVLVGCQPGLAILREEVFGPVLSIMRWRDCDEMLRIANGVELGLTAAVWSNDIGNAMRTARQLQAGYIWVNGVGAHVPAMPYGGYKNSGTGRERGVEELISYTEEKAIHIML